MFLAWRNSVTPSHSFPAELLTCLILVQASHVGKVAVSTGGTASQAPPAFQASSLPSVAITGGSGKHALGRREC